MKIEKSILIVDDEPFNLLALSAILHPRGYDCYTAKGGKEGIEILNKNKEIKVVLMDIMMPEMNGYEAIKEIKGDNKYKDLCVIALTAKAMKEDREKCLAAGATDYVTKPVDINKLMTIIKGININV